MGYDIDIRVDDEDRVDLRTLVRVHEFEAPAAVLTTDRLKVSAAKVMHTPLPHAYAYRFDAPDRSIVR